LPSRINYLADPLPLHRLGQSHKVRLRIDIAALDVLGRSLHFRTPRCCARAPDYELQGNHGSKKQQECHGGLIGC
jgi:hypothetical protein